MKKNLVCLLSRQHVPNLLSVLDQRPDKLFLVESEGMKREYVGTNFGNALECEVKRLSFTSLPDIEVITVKDENDLIGLTNQFSQFLLGKYPTANWVINLTGGTKIMSLAAFQAFQQAANRQFIYCPINDPSLVQMPLSGESYTIKETVSMEAFLLGYGYEYEKSIKNIQFAEKIAKRRQELTYLIASKCAEKNFKIWNNSFNKIRLNKFSKAISIGSGYISHSNQEIHGSIIKEFKLSTCPNDSLNDSLTLKEIQYLDGGWLEEFIWNLLNNNRKELEITDIHLGIVIRTIGTQTQNELDISFMRKTVLNIVECKTGYQQDRMQNNQYKLSAIASLLKALKYKTYLVSNSPSLESVKERSELSNTTQVNAAAIATLAKEPNNIERIKKTFCLQD